MTAELTFEVGILLCGEVRNYLSYRKFTGDDIDWFESSGVFNRTFVVKGDRETVQRIHKNLQIWSQNVN